MTDLSHFYPLAAALTPVGATAVAMLYVWLRFGPKPSSGKLNGKGGCPIEAHVQQLATQQEAIKHLQGAVERIFVRLDALPRDVAELLRKGR